VDFAADVGCLLRGGGGMTFSSDFDRDVSFWLNVVMFDTAVTGLLGSPVVGDSTWWNWRQFVVVWALLFMPSLQFVSGFWYSMHQDSRE
jgi:hypothetical protein